MQFQATLFDVTCVDNIQQKYLGVDVWHTFVESFKHFYNLIK